MPAPVGNKNAARRESGVGKLSASQVRTIKRALRNNDSLQQIRERFGISYKTVQKIRDRETWKWVP